MSTPQLDRLREHCHQLRLYQIEQELTGRLEEAAKKETSYADFLDQLLACEVDAKTHKHQARGNLSARHTLRIDEPGNVAITRPTSPAS
jgi:DNA replication protein DnaC